MLILGWATRLVANGTLANMTPAEAWKVAVHWGLPSLATGNSRNTATMTASLS